MSEVWNIVPIINKGSKAFKWCLWLLHNTVYRVMLLMSEVLKVYCTLYTVASHPYQGEGYLSLLPWGFSWFTTSQSEETALLTFLDFSYYKGDCRQDAQPIPNS